jgi:hypothetical protein
MSATSKRYVYSGHAIGVAAQFDRLKESTGLKHVVPALGAAVLPVTGGAAHAHITGYHYPVQQPMSLSLLSVRHVESSATGVEQDGSFHTDVRSRIEDLDVVEKLHIDLVELHMSSVRTGTAHPVITTSGNRIVGMRLGKVHVKVTLDDTTLCQCGTRPQIAAFYAKQSATFRKKYAWRFGTQPGSAKIQRHNNYYLCTLVKDIQLSGPPKEVAKIKKSGNMIVWPGFGKIFLAEVLIRDCDRRMTMVRLEMGSDAGGSGAIGDAGTNGSVSM